MLNGCLLQIATAISAFFLGFLGMFTVVRSEPEYLPTPAVITAVAVQPTNTALPTLTPTSTPSSTPTPTLTVTVSPTYTPSPTLTPIPSDTPTETPDPVVCRVRSNRLDLVNLRAEPSTTSEVVAQLPNMAEMDVYDVVSPDGVNIWYQVQVMVDDEVVEGFMLDQLVIPMVGEICPNP